MDVSQNKSRLIYDPLYGFIRLTPVEWDIIHTPFYQRLRWIKQLGFSSYIFPGAEHSRFGHSIGAMHNSQLILESCGRAVSTAELFDSKCLSKEKIYHQSIRLAALMHDLGTFCFSHTIEEAYVKFGETDKSGKGKGRLRDDHENLGSYIIKNTCYENGITSILIDYGYDPQSISDFCKGTSSSVMANQILHSEIDCDRMDYLLRDAYYTGIEYGSYDRDYLLYHFTPRRVGEHDILTIKHNALHCVEDFLTARFSWYSQVVRSAKGAKYDAIAERIYKHFLEQSLVYKYSDLLDMIARAPIRFFNFNDAYFMSLLHRYYEDGTLNRFPDIKNMAFTLMFEKGARTARCDELKERLLDRSNPGQVEGAYRKAHEKVEEMRKILSAKGAPGDWMIAEIPDKNIIFVKSHQGSGEPLLGRDPVKITYENGEIKLLSEVENSFISKLQQTDNFIPNVFLSESAYGLLLKSNIIEDIRVPL